MILNVADLYLSFGRTAVLQGFGFDLEAGEIACLLGPFRLRQDHRSCAAVAGFEPSAERGRSCACKGVTLSRRPPDFRMPPQKRRIGMVFPGLRAVPAPHGRRQHRLSA
jgi:iron(III) transport system ATP-binding protein